VGVCVWGGEFYDVWVCMCGFCNVCGCVCVWVLSCVGVYMYGFCNVLVCVCVGFGMCECVGFVM